MKNRIEEIRKEKKIKQTEFAKALDVSRQTISSLENGRYNPSIELAFKIARYFDMLIEEIFIYEDEGVEGVSNYLNYKSYVGSLKFEPKTKTFHGKVAGIATEILFEGKSVLSITESFQKAIDSYLDMCAKNNKEPEKSFKGSFHVNIDSGLHRRAALEASKRDITLSGLVEELLTKSLA